MFTSTNRRYLGAMVAALAVMAVAACEDTVTNPPHSGLPDTYAFVITTDFSTGSASIVSADTLLKAQCNVASVYSDAVARYFDGRIYVVNRLGADNIQVLDPGAGFRTIRQFTVGNGSDPHDIAFVSRWRAFVTRYDSDKMWIVDTNTGNRIGQMDFGWLSDADNLPEMEHILAVGNRMFVSVERLNRNTDWGPVGTSYLAAFDPFSQDFIDADPGTPGVQALALAGANPFGELVLNKDSGKIWVPTVGRFGILDGGIEVVDPVSLTTSGLLITEAQLGGDITDVVAVDADNGVAIITDSNFNTVLVRFNLTAPDLAGAFYDPGSYALQDAELSPDGRLFVSDRSPANPGIRVFEQAPTLWWRQLSMSPADVCLPPSDIEFVVAR